MAEGIHRIPLPNDGLRAVIFFVVETDDERGRRRMRTMGLAPFDLPDGIDPEKT